MTCRCGEVLEERKHQIYDDDILILVIYFRCPECDSIYEAKVGFVKPFKH